MTKTKLFEILKSPLFQSLVLYLILAAYFLPYYQYQINSDGISYISIAQKYLNHDFRNAICGAWGPLISLLLVPFLSVGLKPLLAFKILSLLIGIVTIVQSFQLVKLMDISGIMQNIILVTVSLIILFFALNVITPDLLLVCVSLFLINSLLDRNYHGRWHKGLVCGIFGGALYLTKTYGFPFFIIGFLAVNIIYFFRTDFADIKKKIVRNYIIGMLAFALISIFWIALLYAKYGYITIGTTVSYNQAVFGPESNGQQPFFLKLFPPPNETAISAWEDYSFIKVKDQGFFESLGTLEYFIINAAGNMYKTASFLKDFSFLAIPFLLVAFIYLLEKGKRMLTDNIFLLLVLMMFLFSGYLLLNVEPRYIWLSYILIFVIGAKFIYVLITEIVVKRISKILIVLFFVTSFLIYPETFLYSNRNTGIEIFNLNNKLSGMNIHGRIASTGGWSSTLSLSFYNDWRYYGEYFTPDESELITELGNNEIDYYFVWEPFEQKVKFPEGIKEITDGKIDGLKIYKLK